MASREEPVERRVQLTGGSTYTVSLPKEWATEHGIDSGSVVHLHSRRDRLLLTSADDDDSRGETRIVAGDREPADLSRTVSAAYVAGCETIEVVQPDRTQRRAIREAVRGLVGIEVHAEDEDRLVARTMLDVGDLSPEQTLVQMELTALTMHEEAVDAVASADAEAARRVQRQDDAVDRLFGLVCREFQRSLVDVDVSRGDAGLTTFEYYTCARQIERVADHAEAIASVAERIEDAPPEDVSSQLDELAESSRSIVRRARSGLLDGAEPSTLGTVVADAEAVTDDAAALDRELYERGLSEGYLLGSVLESVARTAEYGVNVAEAGLQAALREPDRDRSEADRSPDTHTT